MKRTHPDRRTFLVLSAAGLLAAACDDGGDTEAGRQGADGGPDASDSSGFDAGPDPDRGPDQGDPDVGDLGAPDAEPEPPWPEPAPIDAPEAPELPGAPFTLGLCSGDPLPDAVVIWTRLAPEPLAADGLGGLDPLLSVPVSWEVALEPELSTIVARGYVMADASAAFTAKIDVTGLRPNRPYWYRFRVGDAHVSPVARTRTAPTAGARAEGLRFGVATCQHYKAGYYAAHRHLAAAEPDLVFFVGDYIYEGGQGGGIRDHDGPTCRTLEAYRNRYALYRGDPDLQAAHAACPWVIIWDDHEVANDYAGAAQTSEEALTRRAAAYRAWWEHMPTRLPSPEGPSLQIHRSLAWGDLFDAFMLDTRQYRDLQPCGGEAGPLCPEVAGEDRTLLGADQRTWITGALAASTARWRVLAQQVLMVPFTANGVFVNPDAWDGYPQDRQAIFDALVDQDAASLLVLTGDMHCAAFTDMHATAEDTESRLLGHEIMTTSISSGGVEVDNTLVALGRLAERQPAVHYFNAVERGFALVNLDREGYTVEYQVVDNVDDPTSALYRHRGFQVARTGEVLDLDA